MLQLEVLVGESFCAVNAGTARAVAIEEVSTLDHELSDLRLIRFHGHHRSAEKGNGLSSTYDPVELAAFIALRPSLRILVLTRAVLAKVLSGFGCDVGEEFHLHPTQWLPWTHDMRE